MTSLPRFYPDEESVVHAERRSLRSGHFRQRLVDADRTVFKAFALAVVLGIALAVQNYRSDKLVGELKAEHARDLATCSAKVAMLAPQPDPGRCWDYSVHMEGWNVALCTRTVYRK